MVPETAGTVTVEAAELPPPFVVGNTTVNDPFDGEQTIGLLAAVQLCA